VNFREGWRGHLWQGRFASFPLDEGYLLAAARYIEQNPVRAGLAATPWEYPWSSAKAHVSGKDDSLVRATPLLERVGDWEDFLYAGTADEDLQLLRRHERTGRPLGSDRFVTAVERKLHRTLRRGKPGPKPSRNS
jgi:putative transposase